jgi:hypothetical protein
LFLLRPLLSRFFCLVIAGALFRVVNPDRAIWKEKNAPHVRACFQDDAFDDVCGRARFGIGANNNR